MQKDMLTSAIRFLEYVIFRHYKSMSKTGFMNSIERSVYICALVKHKDLLAAVAGNNIEIWCKYDDLSKDVDAYLKMSVCWIWCFCSAR